MVGRFELPQLEDNIGGWGPISAPSHLKDVPFAPYNKGDRLGRASDWTSQNQGRYRQNQQGTEVFQFSVGEDEEEYQLVDSNPVQQPKQYKRPQRNPQFQRQGQEPQVDLRGQRVQQRGQGQGGRQQPWYRPGGWQQRNQVQYTPSIRVDPSWSLIDEVQFAALTKLQMRVQDPEDIYQAGTLEYYDKQIDRINPRSKVRLIPTNKIQPNGTTSDDPIIRQLAQKGVAQVFVTDAILVSLMCVTRSLYSWDIVVTRVGDKLFFDKRSKSNIDRVTVNETAPEPVTEDKDNINGVEKLSQEAIRVQQNFVQQVLDKKKKAFQLPNANPFPSSTANVGYKYRKWQISDDQSIVVRCQLDGMMKYQEEDQLISLRAFMEHGPNSEWKTKLDTSRGAVLATELKNNSFKVAKWTAHALLSGVAQIKLGYVSRLSTKDNSSHVLLGSQNVKPADFALQMNLKYDNCWGIVRAIVDFCMSLSDGKYLMIKEPSKPIIKFFQVPEDAFAQEE
eukprot:TRINITY_DN3759_c0_g1_i1.p1 TRINITY_DN3759_c0_g1~~TRINITY_DN3759_c0_g1_i1.p1  ORF type:complete len:505 (+),score=69.71 TRINITY_DN3759_c0_g1_i1:114-1628(+)